MRPVALGRKNWLHIGSPQAGPKVAIPVQILSGARQYIAGESVCSHRPQNAAGIRLLLCAGCRRLCRVMTDLSRRPWFRISVLARLHRRFIHRCRVL